MSLAPLHRALDALAVWREDLVRRPPEPCRLAAPAPLDAFGPLPPLVDAPERPGWWTVPSPRALERGDALAVHLTPAVGPRRGTALLVPPWKIRRPGLVGGHVQLLARAGQEVWLVCPPHHLMRTRPGTRSGDGFVTLDLARLRAVVEQQVVELRACAALAASRGPVGIVGFSLGALAAALAATAPEPLDYAAFIAPPELALVLSTGIGRRYRRLSDAAGAAWPGEAALAEALAPFDARRRASTARRLFVAGARHDAIAPVAGAEALARAWGVEPRLYPRAHLSLIFLCRALRRDLASFVAAP